MRGMGQSPMFTLPRETGPTARGTYSPARPGAVGALSTPSNGAFERSIEHQVPPRGAKAANDSSYSRHEKQGFCAEGGGQAERRTPPAQGPYSLIHGNKSRKPRQHWLSGRFHGQNHPRERTPSGTTTRP